MHRFIVIEGLDGAGKSTQINLLKDYLKSNEIDYRYIHFPRTDSVIYGRMIAEYLRGEYGKKVNPYLIALLYAGDRNDAKLIINSYLDENAFVLVDRYVYSNIAFQCARFKDFHEKEKLKNWILHFEYVYNEIPKPVLSIYLNVPFHFISKQLKNSRIGHHRSYLDGKEDIHESNLKLQKKVEKEYLKLAEENDDIVVVNCYSEKKEMLTEEFVHNLVIDLLKEKKIL